MLIENTAELAALCEGWAKAEYITVDTEFMRENTFYSILCLVQVAGPDGAVAIDPLAPGIDLSPLYDVLAAPAPLKVFHAARQDLEIFFNKTGRVPTPIFDTQVAAMVCGFGESVGYETLAARLAGARIDKSSRFTDWSRRPLSERQVRYALEDVTHLRTAYEKLSRTLERSGRAAWLGEEMALLSDPATYQIHPENAWKRLKVRHAKPRFLAVLHEIAAWREIEAQSRDIPRNRMLRDEALLEIAGHPPRTIEELLRIRGMGRGLAEGKRGQTLIAAVGRALALPDSELPSLPHYEPPSRNSGPLMELLKVLLKLRCDEEDVAAKLIANTSDLERIASHDEADVPALHGWRREIFGNDALALKRGELALAARGDKVSVIRLTPDASIADVLP